jgi:hypothetical protein
VAQPTTMADPGPVRAVVPGHKHVLLVADGSDQPAAVVRVRGSIRDQHSTQYLVSRIEGRTMGIRHWAFSEEVTERDAA